MKQGMPRLPRWLLVTSAFLIATPLAVTHVMTHPAATLRYRSPELAYPLPSNKAAAIAALDSTVNNAREAGAKMPLPMLPSIESDPWPFVQPGIVDDDEGPFSSTQFRVVNSWAGAGGSSGWLMVWAGAQFLDPIHPSQTAGAVAEASFDPSGVSPVADEAIIQAPSGKTCKITDAAGVLLTVACDDHAVYIFDAATRTFR